MSRDETIAWLSRCAFVAARGEPITDIEAQRHRQLVAAEMYRAEARRLDPQPQSTLKLVA